jgi:peptidyl-dipeptidase A
MSLTPAQFVADLETALAPLEDESCELAWQFANTGDAALQERLVAVDMKLHAVLSDPAAFAQVQAWRAAGGHPPELARSLDLLYFGMLQRQLPEDQARRQAEIYTDLTGRFANFRGEAGGRKLSSNDIRDILRDSDDNEERRAAWEASKQIGPVSAPLVLELVALRNAFARAQGYRDAYAMQLATQEIAEAELFALLDEVERTTRAPFAAFKAQVDAGLAQRFGLGGAGELRPWHYVDPFFQDGPPLAEADLDPFFKGQDLERLTLDTFDRIGLDIRPSLAISDLYEREGKDQHAFCMRVGRHPDRVHVLCNCRDNASWAGTMLHEYGHAVYDLYIPAALPYFLREVAHTNSTEAIAMLFGRLTHDPAWLEDVAGVPAATAQALAAAAHLQLSWQMLVFCRWMMVMAHFERALYADPAQDLNGLWWDLAERYQGLTRPEGRDAPDWATKVHLALYPVYYHNYMLGELTASQLQHYIEHTLGGQPLIRQPRTGEWLRSGLFAQGARRPWNAALEHLTGETLQPRYFVEAFARPQAAEA